MILENLIFNLFSLNENDKFLVIKYDLDNLERPFS